MSTPQGGAFAAALTESTYRSVSDGSVALWLLYCDQSTIGRDHRSCAWRASTASIAFAHLKSARYASPHSPSRARYPRCSRWSAPCRLDRRCTRDKSGSPTKRDQEAKDKMRKAKGLLSIVAGLVLIFQAGTSVAYAE